MFPGATLSGRAVIALLLVAPLLFVVAFVLLLDRVLPAQTTNAGVGGGCGAGGAASGAAGFERHCIPHRRPSSARPAAVAAIAPLLVVLVILVVVAIVAVVGRLLDRVLSARTTH